MIRVVLQNNHIRRELRFPCTEEKLGNVMRELYYGGQTSPGIIIAKVEVPEEFKFLEDKQVDLDELNYLAKRMESFWGDLEFQQYFEAMKHEGFTSLKDLINLTFNMNRYPLIQDISDVANIGRGYYLITEGAIPTDDYDNPKYAEKGRELIQSGKGILTEHGLLFVEEQIPFEEEYKGDAFPFYLCDPRTVLAITIRYQDNWEMIPIPCEDMAIRKAAIRIKAPNMEELEVGLEDFNMLDEDWYERIGKILYEQGIIATNALTGAIVDSGIELEKLSALASYAETDDVDDLIKLIENEGRFYYYPNCQHCLDVGEKYIAENEDDYYVSPSLEDYIAYEAFGESLCREHNGKFIDGGYVGIETGEDLNEILGRDEVVMEPTM